jgi:hypothetical protein
MSPQPLTELRAVNIILSSVGEDEVNALGTDTSGRAEDILDEVLNEIQARGWHFNTEDDYEISVASDGSVTLPANVAQFDLPVSSRQDVVLRGNRLYDKVAHSYTEFTPGTLTGSVIFILEWDELPPAARPYFAMEAANRYQKRWFGSESLQGFTEEDLRKAKLLFEDQEQLQSDATIFDHYSVFRTLDRKSGSEFVN